MLTLFSDLHPPFSPFSRADELRRRLDRVFDQLELDGARPVPQGPSFTVDDGGAALVVKADVPGMSEKDLSITLEKNVLTVRGERKVQAPEGYVTHRRERESLQFARSFALPFPVDAEKTSATVKDGVLTVTLTKTPAAQPRQIAVKAL